MVSISKTPRFPTSPSSVRTSSQRSTDLYYATPPQPQHPPQLPSRLARPPPTFSHNSTLHHTSTRPQHPPQLPSRLARPPPTVSQNPTIHHSSNRPPQSGQWPRQPLTGQTSRSTTDALAKVRQRIEQLKLAQGPAPSTAASGRPVPSGLVTVTSKTAHRRTAPPPKTAGSASSRPNRPTTTVTIPSKQAASSASAARPATSRAVPATTTATTRRTAPPHQTADETSIWSIEDGNTTFIKGPKTAASSASSVRPASTRAVQATTSATLRRAPPTRASCQSTTLGTNLRTHKPATSSAYSASPPVSNANRIAASTSAASDSFFSSVSRANTTLLLAHKPAASSASSRIPVSTSNRRQTSTKDSTPNWVAFTGAESAAPSAYPASHPASSSSRRQPTSGSTTKQLHASTESAAPSASSANPDSFLDDSPFRADPESSALSWTQCKPSWMDSDDSCLISWASPPKRPTIFNMEHATVPEACDDQPAFADVTEDSDSSTGLSFLKPGRSALLLKVPRLEADGRPVDVQKEILARERRHRLARWQTKVSLHAIACQKDVNRFIVRTQRAADKAKAIIEAEEEQRRIAESAPPQPTILDRLNPEDERVKSSPALMRAIARAKARDEPKRMPQWRAPGVPGSAWNPIFNPSPFAPRPHQPLRTRRPRPLQKPRGD